jgi:competence protein ComEA
MSRHVLAALLAAGFSLAAQPPLLGQEGVQTQKATATAAPLNLNTATAGQLEMLPGIGARTAARIVEHRQKNGPFKKVEDLMNIRGIGEKNFLQLKPLVTVGQPRPEKPAPQDAGR